MLKIEKTLAKLVVALIAIAMVVTSLAPAVFASGAYKIVYTYDGDISEIQSVMPEDDNTYAEGDEVTILNPSEKEVKSDRWTYTFKGWKVGDAPVDSDKIIMGESDLELSSSWEKNTVLFGTVYEHAYGKAENTGTPLSSAVIKVLLKDDEEVAITTDESGIFEYAVPDGKLREVGEYPYFIEKTSDRLETADTIMADNESSVYIQKRYEPTSEDYRIPDQDGAENGYVKAAGTYRIEGANGNMLTKTLDGTPEDSIDIYINDDGVIEDFYIVKDGKCSKVLSGENVLFDTTAPKINSVSTQPASSSTYVKEHGIYSKTKAELLMETEILESGSGLSAVYLIGKKNGKETRYDAVKQDGSDGVYATSIALDEEVIKDSEVMYLVAEDKFGNKSEEALIAKTVEGSSVTLETIGPDVSISAEGSTGSGGWYNKAPSIIAMASDDTSGLASLKIYQDDEILVQEVYEGKIKDEQSVSAAARIDNPSASGIYNFTVEAQDNSGNISKDEISIKIDAVAPQVKVSGVENGANYASAPSIYISEDERYYKDNGNKITAIIKRSGAEDLTVDSAGSDRLDIPSSVFSEDAEYTVEAVAIDAAGNTSEAKIIRFIKDSSKPNISIAAKTSANSNGWYNYLPEIKATAEDNVSGLSHIGIKEDGKTLAEKSFEERTVSLQELLAKAVMKSASKDGVYTFTLEALDMAGNSAEKTISLKIDLSSPEVSLEGIRNGADLNISPGIIAKEDEDYPGEKGNVIEVVIKRKGADAVNLSASAKESLKIPEKTFVIDGEYTITAKATDAAGNSSKIAKASFIKDTAAPNMTIGTTKNANVYGWYSYLPRIKTSARDELSGLKSFSLTEDGQVLAEYSYKERVRDLREIVRKAILESPSSNGKYRFVAVAEDRAGNKAKKAINVKIDLTAPVLKGSGVSPGAHYRAVPSIKITEDEKYYAAKGALIRYQVRLDSKKIIETKTVKGENSLSIPSKLFKEDGEYAVSVTANDAAENAANTLSYKFVHDSTRPDVKLSGASEGAFYSKPVSIRLDVNERFYQTNNVKTSAVRTLNGQTYSVGFPFKSSGESSSSSRSLSETGTYTVTASAVDKAGNSSGEKKLTFTVDTKEPEITISGVEDGKVYVYDEGVYPNVDFKDDYLESKSVIFAKGGEVVENPNFEQLKENDGTYTLTATAKDKAGNTATKEISFVINRFGSYFVYPDVTKDVMGKAMQNLDNDISILEHNVSKLDKSQRVIYRDGKKIEALARTSEKLGDKENVYTHTFSKDNFQEEGAYELNIISKDEAGNEMESKIENGPVIFYIDRTPPNLSIYGINDKGNKGERAELTVNVSDLLTGVKSVAASVNGNDVALVQNKDKTFTITLEKGMRQEIKVTAIDGAGNEQTITEQASVSDNALSLFIDRFLWPVVGAIVAAIAGLLIFLLGKRKKKNKE